MNPSPAAPVPARGRGTEQAPTSVMSVGDRKLSGDSDPPNYVTDKR